MIKSEEFYSSKDHPNIFVKNKIWKDVKRSFRKSKMKFVLGVDFKSFSFGVAFAVIVFISLVTAVNLISQFISKDEPEEVRINKAYSSAIKELERSLPEYISLLNKSESTKGLVNVRFEELEKINEAICMYKSLSKQADSSPLTQDRLRKLYQLKINAINKIIEIEGDEWL